MHKIKRANDASKWYVDELCSRIVAESGKPEDRFHFGKIILQSLKDTPDFVLQIDGATGQEETCRSVLERSIRCACAFQGLGLKYGDVIIIMAPNHLDLCIPYYAAFYLGLKVASIDKYLKIKELEDIFAIDEPKLVFCQSKRVEDVHKALHNVKQLDAKIIPFDDNVVTVPNCLSFNDMLKTYSGTVDVNDFRATDFDPEETDVLLVSTSGTTGLPKLCVLTQKSLTLSVIYLWCRETKFPTPTRMALVVSPIQWMTAMLIINVTPIMKITRLQSSKDVDQEYAHYLIKTYRPTYMICSPTLLTCIVNSEIEGDFTCFETILIGGSAVSVKLLQRIKKLAPDTEVCAIHGLSEANGISFMYSPEPLGTTGVMAPHLQTRLVNIDNQTDIVEPNKPGELWLKGPMISKGYYKNPEATKESRTEDGWFKTGDIFYRDEHWNFFFVERIKLLLKFMNHQISPAEIQNTILQHPGVSDVGVTGIPDPDRGDLVVACVVKKPGHDVTAQDIKDIVKNNLTDTKQLRGGVVFLDKLPLLATTKLDSKTLKQIAIEYTKE